MTIFSEYLPIDFESMRNKDFLEKMNQSNLSAIESVKNGGGWSDVMACNLCGNKKYDVYLHKNGVDILRCKNCELVFSSSIPNNFNDVYSEEYLKRSIEFYESNSDYRKERFGKERLEILLNHKSSGTLVDIGCGIGWFLEVAKRNYDVVGVEYSDDLRDYLKAKKGIPSAKEIDDIEDNSADIITCFDLIEHVPDPGAFLNLIYKKLKQKGICLLFTPNVDSVGISILKEKSSLICPPDHLYYFNEKTIIQYAEKVDLTIIKVWTKGIDIGDIYSMELSNSNEEISKYLKDNQSWLQHSIDLAGFGNHMRVLLEKN
jgi:2-polyprenyl-3-methyl-5-hydroxy-6-metoxy-1,4-benzoquinol methylase